MVTKNNVRDFGVFMGLVLLPIILVVFGVIAAVQRVVDFSAGLIPLFPIDMINGGGLVLSLAGCVIMVSVGSFVFWAAMPVYREYYGK